MLSLMLCIKTVSVVNVVPQEVLLVDVILKFLVVLLELY